jgi:Icc-related predicted phosphoesterase
MIIDAISDLHGHYPKLEGGDLLIVAGDLTATDTQEEHVSFFSWLLNQKYKKKVYIAGNHDNYYSVYKQFPTYTCEVEYLCDSGTEFEGLKIWGSPWTKKFEEMNPKCMAFTVDTEEELAEKFSKIPNDTDILITHGSPYMILDELIEEGHHGGSVALENAVQRVKPRIHIFGHIHEAYGSETRGSWPSYMSWSREEGVFGMVHTKFINASIVNFDYEPVNKPIRIDL